MARPSVLKIVLGWTLAGVALPFEVLYFLNPMAGLTTLTLLMGALMVFVAPIAHVIVAKYQVRAGKYEPGSSCAWVVAGLVVVFFLLVLSGAFNFT